MNKIINIVLFTIFLIIITAVISLKKVSAENFTFTNSVVENMASVMASENGCGKRENFVYQLILASVMMNGHYYYKHTNVITQDSLCYLYAHGWRNDGYYCQYTFAKLYSRGNGTCTQAQEDQLRLAAKMAISGSFNIPKNVYGAAEKSVMDQLGKEWVSFKPEPWTDTAYFYYPKTEQLSTVDRYEQPVRTDFAFYKTLADCLYNNPTLYGAHNTCSVSASSSSKPSSNSTTKYYVLLYPNGGTGISEGQKFEYTVTTSFSSFPTVTKSNCTLDGWNVGSTSGKLYTKNVEPSDNGQKLYAHWTCSSSNISSNQYTVLFRLNDGTNAIYHSEVVLSGKTVTMPTNPTRNGYTFDGWVTSSGASFNFNTKITSETTLYAKWTINDSSTSYSQNNTNNSNGSTNPQTGIKGISIFILLLIPSLIGLLYYHKYIKNDNQ